MTLNNMPHKLTLEKGERIYRCMLDLSEYDHLLVTVGWDKRIKCTWNDMRWRSVKETQALFKEIIEVLNTLPKL